jgi:outer membrane protein TolC
MNLLLLLAAVSTARAEPTLGQLCRAAVENSEEVRAADARVRWADNRAAEARGGLLPKLKAEAGATEWTESQTVDVPFPLVVRPERQEVIAATAQQPIFAGGSLWKNWRAGRARAQAAAYERLGVREAILRETSELVYRLLEAEEQLRVAQSSLDRRSAHLESARQRRAAGVTTEVETSRAEAEKQAAVAAKIEAEEAEFEAKVRLRALTGMDVSSPSVPEQLSPPPAETDEAASNPDLLAAERRAASASDALTGTKGTLFPSVYVGAQARRVYETPQTAFYIRDETLGFAKVQWDVFSGGSNLAAVGAARAAYDESRREYERVRRDRTTDAAIAREALRQADALVQAAKTRAAAARSAYQTAERRYTSGLDSYLVRLDAESGLTEAEGSYARARWERERAVIALHAARGTLEAALLNP